MQKVIERKGFNLLIELPPPPDNGIRNFWS